MLMELDSWPLKPNQRPLGSMAQNPKPLRVQSRLYALKKCVY